MKRVEINKLDLLWGSIVKATKGHRCEMCGISGRMEAAHVVGRRHRATRWGSKLVGDGKPNAYDLCGHCLCHSCHQMYDEHGPLEGRIVAEVIGYERKAEIQYLAKNTIAKYQDYEEIKAELLKFTASQVDRVVDDIISKLPKNLRPSPGKSV